MHEGDGWQVFFFPPSSAVWCPSRVTRGTLLLTLHCTHVVWLRCHDRDAGMCCHAHAYSQLCLHVTFKLGLTCCRINLASKYSLYPPFFLAFIPDICGLIWTNIFPNALGSAAKEIHALGSVKFAHRMCLDQFHIEAKVTELSHHSRKQSICLSGIKQLPHGHI